MKLTNKTIYILSPNHWGTMQISKHHYAAELARRGNRVYFISPPQLTNPGITMEEIQENLHIVRYKPVFRGKRFLPAFIFNFLIIRQIRRFVKAIGTKPDVVWSFDFTIFFNLRWFKADLTVFHPMDQINHPKAVDLANSADIVFGVSDYILSEVSNSRPPKHVIDHGVAPYFVDHQFPLKTGNTSPQIGYVGNLFIQNLNRDLLRQLIEQNRGHHFHFFGAKEPSSSNISAWVNPESTSFVDFLEQSENVTCHGAVSPRELPEKIQHLDAFLVCYLITKENTISNTHKILEYFCTGKVIISTPVTRYLDSALLEMSKTPDNNEFLELYTQVLQNLDEYNQEENQNKRREFALRNSYSGNVDKMEALLPLN